MHETVKYAWQKGPNNPSKSAARREQIRLEKLGQILSSSHKNKISEAMKRTIKDNPSIYRRLATQNIGRKHTEETKMKIREARARKPKTVKQLKAKLDKVFSIYIRVRDSEEGVDGRVGLCITCEQPIGANGMRTGQAGHFISRRYNSTRFHEKNVHLQCAKCNMWGAGEQYKYSLAINKRYGPGTAESLHTLAQQTKKFLPSELEDMIKEFKEKTELLLK
jgi:hypothetical protein